MCIRDSTQDGGQNGGDHEADEQDAGPHPRAAVGHGGVDADGAHQAAGSHAGAGGNVFQLKHQRGQGAGDHGDHRGGDPDAGIFHDISHLQHGGAQALGQKAAPAVFTEA